MSREIYINIAKIASLLLSIGALTKIATDIPLATLFTLLAMLAQLIAIEG